MPDYTDDEKRIIARWAFGYSGNTCLDEMSADLQYKLYDEFFEDMPINVANGDEGTFPEWAESHVEEIQWRFAELEYLNDDTEAEWEAAIKEMKGEEDAGTRTG